MRKRKRKGISYYKKFKELEKKIVGIESKLEELHHILNTHDNWHSSVAIGLLGQKVTVDFGDSKIDAVLRWTDRYNVCVDHVYGWKDPDKRMVINKGAIRSITTSDYNSGSWRQI